MLPLGSLEWVDFTGQTAFIRAAQSADVEVMRLLLSKGADPRITTFNGTNALMAAAGRELGDRSDLQRVAGVARGRAAVSRPRLRRERRQPDGLAAVHGAANRGSDDIIELLASRGARLDIADKEGRTPITWAEGVFLATNSPVAKPSTIALLQRLLGTTSNPGPPPGHDAASGLWRRRLHRDRVGGRHRRWPWTGERAVPRARSRRRRIQRS